MSPDLRLVSARIRRASRAVASPGDALLAIRMFGWATVLPVMTSALPLRSVVRLMATPSRGATRDPARERQIVALARLAHRSANLGLRDNCLERSLIGYRYLSAANAAPALVVGASAGVHGIEGHVWLTVDGVPVHDDADVAKRFAAVTVFGADGRPGAAPDLHPER